MRLPDVPGLTDAQLRWALRHATLLEKLLLIGLLALLALADAILWILSPWRRR